MLPRPFLNDTMSCASYLFGCTTHGKLARETRNLLKRS
jgi:hypothetical protein